MKASELRTKTADELNSLLSDLKKEQFNLRFQKTTGELEKTSRVREVRKNIAKIRTIQTDRGERPVVTITKGKAKKETKKEAKKTKGKKKAA